MRRRKGWMVMGGGRQTKREGVREEKVRRKKEKAASAPKEGKESK